MTLYNWRNCPQSARTQISTLVTLCKIHLQDALVGIYIHGSLSLGQFNTKISDIDFIVAVSSPITVNKRFDIIKELLHLSNQPHAIEISFMTTDVLNNWTYPPVFELHYSEGWRERCTKAINDGDVSMWKNTYADHELACHLTLVKKYGIHIYGKSIENTIPNIPEQHFISSIKGDAQLSLPQISENPIYTILTPWRIIAYLETKQLLSKVQAGKWAIQNYLDESLSQLVQQAIDCYEADSISTFTFSDEILNRYIEKVNQVLNKYEIES